MENDFSRQIFLHHFICVLYSTTNVICSYLVQSTCEVRKVKYCVWACLVKRINGQCLCTCLSVISDYAITGSTPNCICEAGELNHFALGPGNRISIGSDNGWLSVRHQATTQSHPGLLSIVHLRINFSEIRIKLSLFHCPHTFACDWMYIWLTWQGEHGTV